MYRGHLLIKGNAYRRRNYNGVALMDHVVIKNKDIQHGTPRSEGYK